MQPLFRAVAAAPKLTALSLRQGLMPESVQSELEKSFPGHGIKIFAIRGFHVGASEDAVVGGAVPIEQQRSATARARARGLRCSSARQPMQSCPGAVTLVAEVRVRAQEWLRLALRWSGAERRRVCPLCPWGLSCATLSRIGLRVSADNINGAPPSPAPADVHPPRVPCRRTPRATSLALAPRVRMRSRPSTTCPSPSSACSAFLARRAHRRLSSGTRGRAWRR